MLFTKHQLHLSNTTDGLTNIPDRRYALKCLNSEFSRCQRDHSALCLAKIDVDNFKQVNDVFGYQRGDRLQKEFAAQLAGLMSAEHILGRLAVDRFILIMPHTRVSEAINVIERFKLYLEDFEVFSEAPSVTFSAGLVELCADYKTPENLLKRAGQLLRMAQATGHNRVCVQ